MRGQLVHRRPRLLPIANELEQVSSNALVWSRGSLPVALRGEKVSSGCGGKVVGV